jgi:hypothetical protein
MKISVYITSYNQKGYLQEALDSVLAQTVQPYEVIVIDDGSTDGSRDLIGSYAARHEGLIKVLLNECNLGIPVTKARAAAAATGEWITYLDGDDRWLPEKLACDVETAGRFPEADIIFGNYYFMNSLGERMYVWADREQDVPRGYVFPEILARAFPRKNLYRCELVRASVFQASGTFDPDFAMYHDWELRIRQTRRHRVACYHQPVSEYRLHEGSISRHPPSVHLAEMAAIYRTHRKAFADLPVAERRWARRGFFAWNAASAVEATREVLNDRTLPLWTRRWKAATFLGLCARYAPDHLSLGDLYRFLLPARLAIRLIDGPERAEQRSLSLRRRERKGGRQETIDDRL